MHPSFGRPNSVCSAGAICRCGVGQVLPAANILQERLAQGWGALSPKQKKKVMSEPNCCGWMTPAAPSWGDSRSRLEAWCFPTRFLGCAPCLQCHGCLCCVCACQGRRSSATTTTTHPVKYIPGGPWDGMDHPTCGRLNTRLLQCRHILCLLSFSQRRLWFSWLSHLTTLTEGRVGSRWTHSSEHYVCLLHGSCDLGSKACLRFWADTVFAVALCCCGYPAVAAQSSWAG